MHIRVASPGEYDRHDNVVRFVASIDRMTVRFTITSYALFLMKEAQELDTLDPLQIYATSGRLLTDVVASVFIDRGSDFAGIHFIGQEDVLRVTGRSGEGHDHAPKRWLT